MKKPIRKKTVKSKTVSPQEIPSPPKASSVSPPKSATRKKHFSPIGLAKPWNGDPEDLPWEEMSGEFKAHIDGAVRAAAVAEGVILDDLPCEKCSCQACHHYYLLHNAKLSAVDANEIEAMRFEEVDKWLARKAQAVKEAEEAADAAKASQASVSQSSSSSSQPRSGVLVPSTPPSSQLQAGVGSTTKGTDGDKVQDDNKLPSLMRYLFEEEKELCKEESVEPTVKEESKDEVEFVDDEVELAKLMKKVQARTAMSVHRGNRQSPIPLEFSDDVEEAPMLTAATADKGKRRESPENRKRKLTRAEVEEAFTVKKRKTSLTGFSPSKERTREIIVVLWYRVGGKPAIVEERVPWIFAVADLKETCKTVHIDPLVDGGFSVWIPNKTNWESFGAQEKISGYGEEYPVVLIRCDGVEACHGFLLGANKMFEQ
ncbi:hypothetical protein BDW22DRAFT_1432752 [Trametopsis cervina]|nr:hypothetical protein BDW22DRAFT_1432752 [Trametopsis cervina]